jgi:hypothetical protein
VACFVLMVIRIMKTITFLLAVSLAACAGSARHTTSPTARADALKMFIGGASCAEVAQNLGIDREEARDLIRTGIVDLDRRYYRSR